MLRRTNKRKWERTHGRMYHHLFIYQNQNAAGEPSASIGTQTELTRLKRGFPVNVRRRLEHSLRYVIWPRRRSAASFWPPFPKIARSLAEKLRTVCARGRTRVVSPTPYFVNLCMNIGQRSATPAERRQPLNLGTGPWATSTRSFRAPTKNIFYVAPSRLLAIANDDDKAISESPSGFRKALAPNRKNLQ